MTDAADAWRQLSASVARLVRLLNQTSKQVSSAGTREHARVTCQLYFRETRPTLSGLGLDEQIAKLDNSFQEILRLAEARTSKWIYLDRLKPVRTLLPEIVARIEMARGVSRADVTITEEDQRIILTLGDLIPSAALSFKQAIADLADDNRVSFRGPALELREVLRETLDHLAPDKDVTSAEDYELEKDRKGPTMKQKVRFIRKARGQSKSSGEAPEQATTMIDEMVGTFTRTVYNTSSIATHVAAERKQVLQIKRYVVVALHEILEI